MANPITSTLPHDVELERSVLGGILIRPELLAQLILDVDDFYDPATRAVFAAMRNLEARRQPIDTALVSDELIRDGKLDSVGGDSFLGELALKVPVPENVHAYALALRQHRLARKVCLECGQLALDIRRREVSGDQLLDRVRAIYAGLVEQTPTLPKRPIGEVVVEVINAVQRDYDRRVKGETVHTGIPTGLRNLDTLLGGIPRGVLTIVAGRPGHGKTTLLQTIVREAGRYHDTPILYSYEDSDLSFGQRELASATGVATHKIRSLDMTRGEFESFGVHASKAARRRWRIAQASGMTVEQVCADVRSERARAKERGEAMGGLVVVDYLQRMPVDTKARYDQELGRICNALVDLAVRENIAVIAGSQLNRGIENRTDKMPQLSDLRDSGRLEELAKVVLAVHRPAKYEPHADPTLFQVCVLKNHQGEADVRASLHWALETHLITDRRD